MKHPLSADWFIEKHTPAAGMVLRVKKRLHSSQSTYQSIEVFETDSFGRVLVLDNCVMLSDRDEFIYHEMIAHPAMLLHARPQRVLVVGGGDGGSLRELLRYPSVAQADLVEIDEQVVRICSQWFPALSHSFKDSRVRLHYQDGFQFLESLEQVYDVLLVDSIDAVGEAAKLFTLEFYQRVQRALRSGGIAVFQTESPFYNGDVCLRSLGLLRQLFRHAYIYTAQIPTYPGGFWSFCMASDQLSPKTAAWQQTPEFLSQLKYFTPSIGRAAFVLPNYVKQTLQKGWQPWSLKSSSSK